MMKTALKYCVIAVCAASALIAATAAIAQSWPTKPNRIIVGFPAGGGLDFFVRLTALKLQEQLGQQMIVENCSGAAGIIGADIVAKAAPDGYTVLFASSAELTINQHLYPKMPYDPARDFAPVSYASHSALLFSVNPSIPAKSLKEVIALARARPGQLTYATAGTSQQLAGELLKLAAKINIVNVPYKGGAPAVIDMVGGQVSMGLITITTALPHARSGRLHAIAVTTAKRSETAPDLPTFAELGYPAMDLVVWFGVVFPAKTPPEIVNRMSTEVNRAVQLPDVKAKLLPQGRISRLNS